MSSTIRFLCDTGEVVNARSYELVAAGVKNKNKKIGKKYKNNKDSLNKNNFLLVTYHSDFTGANGQPPEYQCCLQKHHNK